MMDTRSKGANANYMGRYSAKMIAIQLNLSLPDPNSNDVIYRNEKCVIKTSRMRNTKFGITNRKLNLISGVILAIEVSLHDFELYYVPLSKILSSGTGSTSTSTINRTTNFNVSIARDVSEKICNMHIDLSEYDLSAI